jgi:endonuclease-3
MENKQIKAKEIIKKLEDLYPKAGIQLDSESPFQLLVAVILSAQCTDARVNIITKDLFAKYPKVEDYITLPIEELEKLIFSAGFYHSKAKGIKGTADMIVNEFGGEVPDNMDDLLRLPGVGRKSANVILGHCYDTPGIVVDTHVKRIAFRLGLTTTKDPLKVEFELMDILPEEKWVLFTHLLINHGRAVCTSRKAKCEECVLNTVCEMKL